MQRLRLFAIVLAVMALAVSAVGVGAQDAPQGEFNGTWDYYLPPEHHFNGFTEGGPQTNLGVVFRQIVEMPPAYLMWASDEYEPLLASDWGFTEDNSAYEFTIHEDATWSDGTPVTSEDVVATYALGRIMDWQQFDYIDEVEAVDEKTARFNFIDEPSLLAERLILKDYISAASSYGDLPQRAMELAESGATPEDDEWGALREEIIEYRPDELLASGPYTYTMDDVSDSNLTLSWQPNSIFSDSVNFGQINIWKGETEATTPLVLEGTIWHATNVYPPSTQQAFDDAGINLVTTPRGYGPALLFNHDVEPWDNVAVRKATALVIERGENAFLTNGFGAEPTVYMSGLSDSMTETWLLEEDIEQLDRYEFDTERAADILTEAGFSRNDDGIWADEDGNTISAEYKFPAEFVDFASAAQNAADQMNDFGFDITLRAVPWQQTAADIRAGDFELSIWSWASGSPFPSQSFFGPVQRFNYVALDDQPGMNFDMEFEYESEMNNLNKMINLDEMINNVNNGLDIEVQRERAGEVALIINDLMPYVPLNYILSTEPMNTNFVDGVPPQDDPIYQNPSSDHFLVWLMLNGDISPVE